MMSGVSTPLIEKWRGIPGWPNYRISDMGRVKRLAGVGSDGRRVFEKILKPTISPRNKGRYQYVSITLGNASNHESFSLARLVLLAFAGPSKPGQECRHLDDNSLDCRLKNLAWGSRLENKQDAIRNGKIACGQSNGQAKLTEECVREIRKTFRPFDRDRGGTALARRYGVLPATISEVVNHKSWRAARD